MADALSEEPTTRYGRYPFGTSWEGMGQWIPEEERFDRVGVTAHYSSSHSWSPTLGAVTVHGRTGPQVEFENIPLIGTSVTTVDTALIHLVERQDRGLVVGCRGDLGLDGLNMYVRATRTGDTAVSEARFCKAE
ncbi:hypothetical protein EAO69_05360 [Streptomyces sp. me109]|nr:hypothetical protein EAO69_05360 [Streptomyces sp. me109]